MIDLGLDLVEVRTLDHDDPGPFQAPPFVAFDVIQHFVHPLQQDEPLFLTDARFSRGYGRGVQSLPLGL